MLLAFTCFDSSLGDLDSAHSDDSSLERVSRYFQSLIHSTAVLYLAVCLPG